MRSWLHFAVLGHPITHSISPAMHAAAFAAAKLPHTYEAIDVPDRRALEDAVLDVRRGILEGANVTLPHKRAVLALVDSVDESAALVGAANTLVRTTDARVVAHNTDAAGLADDLAALGARPKTAVVIGAGGGALAAVAALGSLGATLVAVTARAWPTSEHVLADESAEAMRKLGALPCAWPVVDDDAPTTSAASQAMRLRWIDIAASADVVVQATSAGMTGRGGGDAIAALVPWSRLSKHAIAYDLVYTPRETPFLRAASSSGLRAASGLGMLVRQGARAFSLWLGASPDVEAMRRAAEHALATRGT